MSTYAVALISHISDDGLKIKVVTAENWWDALDTAFPKYIGNLGDLMDLDEAKREACSQDWEFNVVEIPSGRKKL